MNQYQVETKEDMVALIEQLTKKGRLRAHPYPRTSMEILASHLHASGFAMTLKTRRALLVKANGDEFEHEICAIKMDDFNLLTDFHGNQTWKAIAQHVATTKFATFKSFLPGPDYSKNQAAGTIVIPNVLRRMKEKVEAAGAVIQAQKISDHTRIPASGPSSRRSRL